MLKKQWALSYTRMRLNKAEERTAEPSENEPQNIECRRVESLRSVFFIK